MTHDTSVQCTQFT